MVGDYTKSLGLHNLGAMIGYSYQDDDDKGIYQWAKDFPTDMFGPWNIGSMNDMKDNKAAMTSYRNTHKLISFFGRLTYNYNEKYMPVYAVKVHHALEITLNGVGFLLYQQDGALAKRILCKISNG